MTTRSRRARRLPMAHRTEPDGMTERVEVLTPKWHVGIFLLGLLAIVFAVVLQMPVDA